MPTLLGFVASVRVHVLLRLSCKPTVLSFLTFVYIFYLTPLALRFSRYLSVVYLVIGMVGCLSMVMPCAVTCVQLWGAAEVRIAARGCSPLLLPGERELCFSQNFFLTLVAR